MNAILWIIQGLLALVFALVGAMMMSRAALNSTATRAPALRFGANVAVQVFIKRHVLE
jgi:flagellar basal body-associated protein FliL